MYSAELRLGIVRSELRLGTVRSEKLGRRAKPLRAQTSLRSEAKALLDTTSALTKIITSHTIYFSHTHTLARSHTHTYTHISSALPIILILPECILMCFGTIHGAYLGSVYGMPSDFRQSYRATHK